MIAWPEPNNKYIIHPNASITAINKKTAGQLCVTCRMCPEKYTPRKPEKKRKYIIGSTNKFPPFTKDGVTNKL